MVEIQLYFLLFINLNCLFLQAHLDSSGSYVHEFPTLKVEFGLGLGDVQIELDGPNYTIRPEIDAILASWLQITNDKSYIFYNNNNNNNNKKVLLTNIIISF